MVMEPEKQHVGTLSKLRPLLRESMGDLEPVAQDAVITVLQSSLEQVKTQVDSEHRYVNKSLNETDVDYAIHNSDLALLKEATSVAAACYALLQNPVAVIGGLVVLLFQYRRKRIKLSAEQGIVLRAVKQATHPGWSCQQILSQLPLSRELTTPEVQSILEGLKSVTKMDGSETALVRERDELWLAVDV